MLVETYFNHVWISGFVPLLSAAKERYWDACRAWALEKKQCHGKSVEKKRIDLLAVRWFFDPPFAEFLNTKRSKASRPLSQNAIIVESCSFEGYPYAVWIVRFLMFLMHLMALKGVRHSLDWFVWKPSYQSQHPKWISPYQRFSISILVEGFQYKSKMTHGNHNIIITNSQSKQHQNMLCCIRIIYIYIQINHGNFLTQKTPWLKHKKNTKLQFLRVFFATTGDRPNWLSTTSGWTWVTTVSETMASKSWLRSPGNIRTKTGAKRFGCI